jgi:internalin A
MLKLVKLQKILLHGNRRLELPTEILGEVGAFTIFSIVPRSNEAQGILSYYFARKSGTRPLNEMKLVVVGRGAAGKTSLLKNLISGDFDPQEKETPGIEITLWNIPIETDEIIKLNTWDFGGQEILHATHQFFFSERCLYLLVLAGRDGQQQADAEYWLQLIGSFGGDSKVIVALNKSDEHQFDLNRQTLFDKYPGRIAQFCETDCLTGRGVEQLRQIIQDQVVRSEHRRTPFPEVWFEIKESLAKVQSDFYSWDAFVQLCDATGETDPRQQEILAEYLHALGIALNYSRDNRLADTHVLNPRWVTEGVYSLIRNGQKHGTASIDCNMIGDILNKNRYPRSKHDFLLRLMELYQLCFKLPHHDSIYLIPELLSRNQPNISDFVDGCDLSFFYSYSVLPEGLLPRFIVQTHQLSEGYDRWRSGVELRWENCGAIVVADAVEKFVKIFIKGPPSRCREFLAIIRQNFELQHQALKGISILEKIPLRGRPDVLLSYRDLLKREDRKENTFYPENMDEQVSVRELLDGIEPAAIREERRKSKSLQHSAGVPQVIFIDSNVGQIFGDSMQDEGKKVFQQINGGTFNDSAIVGNAEKFDWHAKINCADPGQIKDELNKLNVLIAQVLAQASPHVTEDISRNMTIFAEQASAKSPDKDYLRMAARKLHVGVQSFTAFANPILETLDKIVGLVG